MTVGQSGVYFDPGEGGSKKTSDEILAALKGLDALVVDGCISRAGCIAVQPEAPAATSAFTCLQERWRWNLTSQCYFIITAASAPRGLAGGAEEGYLVPEPTTLLAMFLPSAVTHNVAVAGLRYNNTAAASPFSAK